MNIRINDIIVQGLHRLEKYLNIQLLFFCCHFFFFFFFFWGGGGVEGG